MFHSNEDWDDDDWFKHKHSRKNSDDFESSANMAMTIFACVAAALVILAIILCCCRRSRNRGQVISTAVVVPPVPPGPNNPLPAASSAAAYPQQQYTPYPTHAAVSYPTPSPYPVGSPYPAPAPYPAAVGPPYPAPHGGAPFPQPAPLSTTQMYPSAPDPHATFFGVAPPGWHPQALPPSYEQAVNLDKPQPPYNPHAPY